MIMAAKDVAEALAYRFLKDGLFRSSVRGGISLDGYPIAAHAADGPEFLETKADFHGVVVQAVGYELGAANPKVHIYVTKGSDKALRALDRNVDGIEIEVDKIGLINVRIESASGATNQGNFYERVGRVCCGSSCAPVSEKSSGTLGALVRKNGQLFALSNNHVFAGCNHVPVGTPVMSPSDSDARAGLPAPREIGQHTEIHELRSGDPALVQPCTTDAAIARVINPNVVSSWQGDAVSGYDTPQNIIDPSSGMGVKKFGRTTGLTRGAVESKISLATPVQYQSKHFKGLVWFCDVWVLRAPPKDVMAMSGDSGSLVVTDDAQDAIGLIFATPANTEYAYMIPLNCITQNLGIASLVTGHGIN